MTRSEDNDGIAQKSVVKSRQFGSSPMKMASASSTLKKMLPNKSSTSFLRMPIATLSCLVGDLPRFPGGYILLQKWGIYSMFFPFASGHLEPNQGNIVSFEYVSFVPPRVPDTSLTSFSLRVALASARIRLKSRYFAVRGNRFSITGLIEVAAMKAYNVSP